MYTSQKQVRLCNTCTMPFFYILTTQQSSWIQKTRVTQSGKTTLSTFNIKLPRITYGSKCHSRNLISGSFFHFQVAKVSRHQFKLVGVFIVQYSGNVSPPHRSRQTLIYCPVLCYYVQKLHGTERISTMFILRTLFMVLRSNLHVDALIKDLLRFTTAANQ